MRFFSDKDRPVHMGPYPLERLSRQDQAEPGDVPPFQPLDFQRPETPDSIVNAMGEYQAMLDALDDIEDTAAFDQAMAEEGPNVPWEEIKADLGWA